MAIPGDPTRLLGPSAVRRLDLVGVVEAARLYGASVETMKRYARAGRLPARKGMDGRWYFDPVDVALDDFPVT
jgi:hypothetical protein